MTIKMTRALGAAALAAMLAACGGGGGGGDNNGSGSPTSAPTPTPTPTPAANSRVALQFDQKQVSISTGEDTVVPVTLTGTLNMPIDGKVYVWITENSPETSSFRGDAILTPSADGKTFTLQLLTNNYVGAGSHSGNLSIHLCTDQTCQSEYGTQQASIPFTLKVAPASTTAGTITPDVAMLHASYNAGSALPQTLKLAFSQRITEHHQVRLTDVSNPYLDPVFTHVVNNPDRMGATATVMFDPKLPQGSYTGVLKLEMCMDTTGCATTDPASAITLPYQIDVGASVTPGPLSALPGAPEWSAWQGNAAHNGFVPVTLDPAHFSPRWTWQTSRHLALTPSRGAVSAAGTVWVATGNALEAVSEADGSESWSQTLNFPAGGLATQGGIAYGEFQNAGGSFTWGGFDSAGHPAPGSGVMTWNAAPNTDPLQALYDSSGPVLFGQQLYMAGGAQGGIRGIDISTGRVLFDSNNIGGIWSPAVDDQYLYVLARLDSPGAANLEIHDRMTGALHSLINFAGKDGVGNRTDMNVTLGAHSALLLGDNLTSVDLAAGKIAWQVLDPDLNSLPPAVGNGVVYWARNRPYQLEARDEVTGAVLWSWQPGFSYYGQFMHNVVVTNNLVFVGTNTGTYAISLATHQPVWFTPLQGNLSISANGTLFISAGINYLNTPNNVATVAAFNLH